LSVYNRVPCYKNRKFLAKITTTNDLKAVPTSEVSLKMPICWSEATKTYITGVGLLVLWPVINVGWLATLIYIICTPLLHYVFYKVSPFSLIKVGLNVIKTVTADPGYIPTDRNIQYSSIIELAENDKLDSSTLCTSSLIKVTFPDIFKSKAILAPSTL
jgi:hypothetical protein